MSTPNRDPQEYSRKIIRTQEPGRYVPSYTPTVFSAFPVWGQHSTPSPHDDQWHDRRVHVSSSYRAPQIDLNVI